jgi:hypothetical protein
MRNNEYVISRGNASPAQNTRMASPRSTVTAQRRKELLRGKEPFPGVLQSKSLPP